ncbi:MAG TPA: hypothetical protein VN871_06185 [Mycobacterium sp.]|nr:hypothetical protein [Mycobacterium sp.]
MADKKKGPLPGELPADPSLLSDVERQELTKSAQKAVDEDRKQTASDEFFKKEQDRLRRRHIPAEEYVNIVIDSAPYVPNFMIDGEQFFNGYEYRVTRAQAAVLCEQMQRSWQHQDEVDGRSRFAPYRRAQGMHIGEMHAGTATRGLGPGGSIDADL